MPNCRPSPWGGSRCTSTPCRQATGLAFVPRPAHRAFTVGHVECHVLEPLVAGQLTGRKVHRKVVERRGELLEVRDFASHEKAQGVLNARVGRELLEIFVHDLGPRLRRDVAAQVDSRIAVGVHICTAPWCTRRIANIRSGSGQGEMQGIHRHRVDDLVAAVPPAGDRGHPIADVVGLLEVVVETVEQHRDHRPDHLEMAEFLGRDVHE